ncbi:MAG: hypothetical protein E7Z98_09260 [Olsenella sp.]|nr:hypothetical protein [Olsenella sp.]
MSKKIGFFVLFAAVVVDAVAMFLYGGSYAKTQSAYIWMAVAAVIGLVAAFAGPKAPAICNWGPAVAAAAMAAGIAYGATVMSDPIGYYISGLYQFSTLQPWIIYTTVGVIALVLFLVAGFMGVASED